MAAALKITEIERLLDNLIQLNQARFKISHVNTVLIKRDRNLFNTCAFCSKFLRLLIAIYHLKNLNQILNFHVNFKNLSLL